MKHDQLCEWVDSAPSPACRCAERAYLATASEEEREAWSRRRGYDTNHDTQWGTPPRGAA